LKGAALRFLSAPIGFDGTLSGSNGLELLLSLPQGVHLPIEAIHGGIGEFANPHGVPPSPPGHALPR
jgi:hypothetical protein